MKPARPNGRVIDTGRLSLAIHLQTAGTERQCLDRLGIVALASSGLPATSRVRKIRPAATSADRCRVPHVPHQAQQHGYVIANVTSLDLRVERLSWKTCYAPTGSEVRE